MKKLKWRYKKMYGCPYKFAIDYLIKNGIKLEEDCNNHGRQVVKIAIEAIEKQIKTEKEIAN